MTDETPEQARARREAWRNANWTRYDTQKEHGAIEYGEEFGAARERARIEARLWKWHANEVDSDGEETWASVLIRDIIETLQGETGTHTSGEGE